MTSKGWPATCGQLAVGAMPLGPWQEPQNCLLCTANPPMTLAFGSEATALSSSAGVKAAAEASIGRAANALKIISLAFIVLLRDQPKLSAVIVFIQLCRYWAARACSAGWALRYW